MLLEGIFLPVTTPFGADGRLFAAKLEVNVDRYGRTPAAGLLLLGAVGEPDALTDAETLEVLSVASEAAAARQVLLAGVGRASVRATLELTESAARLRYDAVAVRAPRDVSENEAQVYFEVIADRSPLPLVLLAEETRPLSAELVARLARHPNVLGLIDSAAEPGLVRELKMTLGEIAREVTVTSTFEAVTGRMLRGALPELAPAAQLAAGGIVTGTSDGRGELKTRRKRVGFQVLAGRTETMLACWDAGAAGATPGLGACVPQGCCEVWQAFRDGDPALAAEKQERVAAAAAVLERIAALKYGCDLNAYFGGRPRLPRLPLTGEERAAVEQALAGMRN